MNDFIEKPTFKGRGETIEEAFTDAATKAINGGVPPGTPLDVVRWTVVVSNPKVSDHLISVS